MRPSSPHPPFFLMSYDSHVCAAATIALETSRPSPSTFYSDPAEDAPDFAPEYNIPPSTIQPVIRQSRDSGKRELVGMRWGLIGYGSNGPDPKRATFNARVESIEKSGLWRRPSTRHSCPHRHNANIVHVLFYRCPPARLRRSTLPQPPEPTHAERVRTLLSLDP